MQQQQQQQQQQQTQEEKKLQQENCINSNLYLHSNQPNMLSYPMSVCVWMCVRVCA